MRIPSAKRRPAEASEEAVGSAVRRSSSPRVGHLGRLVVLLAAALVASGCAVLYPGWWECKRVTSAPLGLAVSVVAAPRVERGYVTRRRASVGLFEGGGISIYLSPPREFRYCQELPQDSFETWVQVSEALASHLENRRGEEREVITAVGDVGEHLGLAAVEDLSPEALEAAEVFACLALETFGKRGERAIREAGPDLVARIDFPSACSPASETRDLLRDADGSRERGGL